MPGPSGETFECACACGARVRAPLKAVGRKVRCPKCGHALELKPMTAVSVAPPASKRERPPAKQPTDALDKRIEFRCACGKRLRVPVTAAGRRVKCPNCGQVQVTPAGPGVPEIAAAESEGSLDSLLDGLSHGEAVAVERSRPAALGQPLDGDEWETYTVAPQSAPRPLDTPLEAASKSQTCPCCRKAYGAKAVLCPECGINLKTGRALLMVAEERVDHAYMVAQSVLSWLSWICWFGLYPIASEGFGVRKPWITRGIAVVTIFVSLWYLVVYVYNPEPTTAHANLMLWQGGKKLTIEEYLHDEGWTYGEIAEARENGWLDDAPPIGEFHGYQLLTHMLLHADLLHLAGNMLFLIVLGGCLNTLIGNVLTAILYPLLGIISAMISLAAYADEPMGASLGASGAIMGLAGMYLVLFPIHKVHMVFWWRWGLIGGFSLSLKMFAVRGLWVVLFYIAFDVLYVVLGANTGTDHWAHLGGFMGGVVIALALLFTRLVNARGGDLVSAVLGRHAWQLLGKPNRPARTLW